MRQISNCNLVIPMNDITDEENEYMSMSLVVFIVTELCLAYILYRGVRAMSGQLETNRIIEILSYIGYILVTGIAYKILNMPLITLGLNLVCLYLICINYEGSIKSYMFRVAAVYILLVAGETIAMIIMNQQFSKVSSFNKSYSEDSVLLLARLIQFMIIYIVEKTITFRDSNELSLYNLILFILTGVISGYLQFVMCFVLKEQKALLLITDICILILNFLIVIIYEKLELEMIKNKDNQIISLKNEAYENEIQLMLNNEDNIKLLRHDIKNHCLAIDSYLGDGHIDKARDYLKKMLEKTEVQDRWMDSGNPIIDGLINYKLHNIDRQKTKIHVESKIPAGLKVDDYKMAVIIGNLLDNAITAISSTDTPEINIAVSYMKENLIISIDNTYDGQLIYKNNSIVSRKKDKEYHGFGIKSIEKEIEGIGGVLDISHDNERFVAKVVIPL